MAFYHLILGRKKAGDLFQISCSVCRYVGGGYLIVKVRGKLTRCEADKLAFILSALILAVLFNMCFVYGCWYFNAKSVLEVIVFIIGLIVLRRDTLRSSALMGTISIVLAVLLDMVIPFHFG